MAVNMKKKEHWLTEDFPQFIDARLNTPFAWGSNDCALFAADAIQAITGVDIADDFRGKYKAKTGAVKAINSVAGGSTLADATSYCAQKHGLPEYEYPLMAKRGELVLVKNADGEEIAGVVSLNGRYVFSPGETGLLSIPITNVTRAWQLPDEHEWTAPKWHSEYKDKRVEDTSLLALPSQTN
jgi:hypothetical protein